MLTINQITVYRLVSTLIDLSLNDSTNLQLSTVGSCLMLFFARVQHGSTRASIEMYQSVSQSSYSLFHQGIYI